MEVIRTTDFIRFKKLDDSSDSDATIMDEQMENCKCPSHVSN
jgi:hypothetical protein